MLGPLLLVALAVSEPQASGPCTILTEQEEGQLLLIGSCSKSAVVIGAASSYEAAAHQRTGAVAVLVQRGASIQVVLVRPGPDGSALLENITGSLARKIGRSPDIGLVGLTIDLSRFTKDGVIRVTAGDAKGSATSPAEGIFSVDAIVAHEAARAERLAGKSRAVDESIQDHGREWP